MTNDDRLRARLHMAAQECLSGVERMPSQKGAVFARLEERRAPARKTSFVFVCAIVLTMVLAGAAAAGLGLFGQLREQKTGETSRERLERLEEATREQSVQSGAAARLQGEDYDLTVEQVYCDGRKLYYSYTLRTNGERLKMIEGMPDGFEEWDRAYPGERFEDVLTTYMGEAADRQASEWLNSREQAHVIVNHTYVGDGAELPDGTHLSPVDSGMTQMDDATMTAYYEVALPEGYTDEESIEFVLNVMTSTSVYYQDETGVYAATRYQTDALTQMTVSVPVTGHLMQMTGKGTADGYPAKVQLYISDVDVSGTVRIDAPRDYSPEGYVLAAGGAEYPNLDEWTHYDGAAHVINLRFDLPMSMTDMCLIPLDRAYICETIELKGE